MGGSAVNLDILRASCHDRNWVVLLVLVVVTIILGVLLRAVVALLLLVATVVLLAREAALGVSTLASRTSSSAGADPRSRWTFQSSMPLHFDYNTFLKDLVRGEQAPRDAAGLADQLRPPPAG